MQDFFKERERERDRRERYQSERERSEKERERQEREGDIREKEREIGERERTLYLEKENIFKKNKTIAVGKYLNEQILNIKFNICQKEVLSSFRSILTTKKWKRLLGYTVI